MRNFFLSLFTIFFIYSCSSPNDKTGTTATTIKPVIPVQPSQSDSQMLVLDTSRPFQSDAQREAIDSRIREESTLSLKQSEITIPPYSLEKVQAAIEKLQSVNDSSGDGFSVALNEPIYDSYSISEKFTYNMIHAEDYSQMCDILPQRTNEKSRIYGQLRDFFGEYKWSERQIAFFKAHQDSVEQLMKAVINERGAIGMNFLDVIVSINAQKMIPYLIDIYHKNNLNHYILTTLMLLMKNNKYPEFMQSASYDKLYHRDTDTYSAFLVYNKANEDLIIKRATNFFNDWYQH